MTSKRSYDRIPLLDKEDPDTSLFGYGSNVLERSSSKNSFDQSSYSDGKRCEISQCVLDDFKNVAVTWSNINCYVPNTSKRVFGRIQNTGLFKQILFGVNGVVQNGTLMAIMGASGAGKSTLLNVLTCRNLGKLKVEGEVRVNGVTMHSNIKKLSAYVQQLDVFYGKLKVREHLLYNAVLRIGDKIPQEVLQERVDVLIEQLGLGLCKYESINSNSHHVQGLAGSEKKLLSIASELLCDPPIIFLDEPTTGLDSKMAEKVLKILQKLAHDGKCIICTIHQPSSLIYNMFNSTYLLAEGRLIFQGSQQEALQFFADTSFPCAENFNPADHFIHTLAIKPSFENDCRAKVMYISRKFQDTSEYGLIRKKILTINSKSNNTFSSNINQRLDAIPMYRASYWQEIKIQTWKQGLDLARDSKLLLVRIMNNVICTIILSLMILHQKNDQIGVNNINGGIFSIVNNIGFLAIVQFSSFVKELKHHRSEHENGMCRSGSFFVAKSISDIPLFVFNITIAATITYWSIGLYPGFKEFVVFYIVLLFVYQFSYSLNVLMIGSVIDNLGVGLTITAVTVNVMMLVSGFLVNDSTIPIYFRWLKYLSCQRFGFEIMTINQWKNIEKIECTSLSKDSCYNSGKDVINFLSFSSTTALFDIILLIGLTLFFRIVSLLIIIFRGRERKLN